MIKAILIDDEKQGLQALSILLREHCPQVQVLEECFSARAGIKAIETHKPDVVFLDVEMPVMNGFELLEQFHEIPFSIIFTTSYDQYAIKAIRSSALDYLLKPIDPQELIASVKKAEHHHLPLAEQIQMLAQQIRGKQLGIQKIAIPTSEGFELVPASLVLYLEANGNYTHLLLKDGSKIIACRTLKEMEEQLQDFNFFVRVHQSFIVNLNQVIKYVRGEGGYLVMSNGSFVNVSRSRKDSLLRFF